MPVYEHICEACGLQFEVLKPMAKRDDPEACVECGEATRKLVSAANHTFAHTPVGGPRPQNTGVHALDYGYDRVIGRDAEAKWKLIQDRQKHKKQVIKSTPGATGHDLSRTNEGDYKVMKPEERKAAETGRNVHRQAMQIIESSKESPAPRKVAAGGKQRG